MPCCIFSDCPANWVTAASVFGAREEASVRKLYRTYVEALHKAWSEGYWVTWQPSVRLKLGDIGTVRGGQLVPIADLSAIGVTIEQRPGDSRDQLTYDGAGSASVTFKTAGTTPQGFQALAAADAGALVTFSRENALVLALRGLAEARVDNVPALAKPLVQQYWKGWWRKDYAVVTHLVTAASATILASAGADARVELRASATLGQGPLQLADLSANIGVASASRMGLQITAEQLTPFFRVLRLKPRWWGGVEERYGDPQGRLGAKPVPVPSALLDEAVEAPDDVVEEAVQPASSDDETDGDDAQDVSEAGPRASSP
jgi:hypothetical protein